MRLITIPISHYCERARWALEHAGLVYREEPHLQLLHYRHTKAAGGGKTVPVLVTDDGRVLDDSAQIVAFANDRAPSDRKLYPSDSAARSTIETLERELSDRFGVETRRVMYFHFFGLGQRAMRFNGGAAPRWERWAMWLAFPLVRPYAMRYLDVSEATMERGRDDVQRTFDEIARRLSDGRPYLMGDTFSAADLTFACMAAAVTAPSPYGTPLPKPEDLPDAPSALLEHFREHPAGRFALRMFRDHRRVGDRC